MQQQTPKNPKSRLAGLLVEQVGDDTIVYDKERNEAHSLNRTAAEVWRYSDGTSSVPQLAAKLGADLDTETNETVVQYAIDELSRAHLLEGEVPEDEALMTRRDMVRRMSFAAAIALPVVLSISAPTPAMAASGSTQNDQGQNTNTQGQNSQ